MVKSPYSKDRIVKIGERELKYEDYMKLGKTIFEMLENEEIKPNINFDKIQTGTIKCDKINIKWNMYFNKGVDLWRLSLF